MEQPALRFSIPTGKRGAAVKRLRILVVLSSCLVFVTCAFVVLVVRAQNIENARAGSTLCETGCLLPPTGLIAWWPGDGNAKDIQLGNDGVLMNGATFAPGLVRQALRFDGEDDFVDVPDAPALHAVTTGVTVDAWINPQLAPPRPDTAAFILARRDPNISEGFSLFINNDGFLRARMGTDFFMDVDSEFPVIQFNGKWQHVAVTADTTTGKVVLYLNGAAVPQRITGELSGQFANVTHLFIGQHQGSDTPEGRYKGLIDEVEVHNRPLSAGEIRAIFQAGARGKCKPRRED